MLVNEKERFWKTHVYIGDANMITLNQDFEICNKMQGFLCTHGILNGFKVVVTPDLSTGTPNQEIK